MRNIEDLEKYLRKRIYEKTEMLNSQVELIYPIFYKSHNELVTNEEFGYLEMRAVILCYKSLSEMVELLEIYNSNFKNEKEEQNKRDYNKFMSNIERILDHILKIKLIR